MDPTQTPPPAAADQPLPVSDAAPAPEPVLVAEPVAIEPIVEPLPVETSVAAVPEPPLATKPVSDVEPQPAAEPAAAPAPGEHVSRILLVEDDDSLANVYVTRLQAEGFDVRRCANGEEALAAAISYKPNLVLLDVMMPRVSGFDVLDIMRNTPETANLKVIMLTALSQESDVARAKELGADEYLIKSQVVIADVIERIRRQLSVK